MSTSKIIDHWTHGLPKTAMLLFLLLLVHVSMMKPFRVSEKFIQLIFAINNSLALKIQRIQAVSILYQETSLVLSKLSML